jgi:hypothetical protein
MGIDPSACTVTHAIDSPGELVIDPSRPTVTPDIDPQGGNGNRPLGLHSHRSPRWFPPAPSLLPLLGQELHKLILGERINRH